MTSKIDDGGLAFPVVKSSLMRDHAREAGRFTEDYTSEGGMSLRDWFAGQALAAFIGPLSYASVESRMTIAKENGIVGEITNARVAASVAYGYADAMIAARKAGAA